MLKNTFRKPVWATNNIFELFQISCRKEMSFISSIYVYEDKFDV